MAVFTPGNIEALTPYRPGKPISELARERGLEHIVKLASNENPLGPSPKAMEAIKSSLAGASRYVDPPSYDLTHALAERHNIAPERIICGAGTDALLAYIIQTFSEERGEVLTAEGTFIGIFVNVKKLNRSLATVPLKNYAYDLDALAERINENTRIVYIASPNNPTGTIVTAVEFERLMDRVPETTLVILDEAYYNYAKDVPGYHNGLRYDYPNLIVTRTFSKDYGLAGLRAGYAVGPEDLIRKLYKVRLPFEPCFAAQIGARAALEDDEFLARTLSANRDSLRSMRAALAELGITHCPGAGNFLLMTFPDSEIARRFAERCMDHGLILRHTPAFGVPEGVRMNSGTAEETEFAIDIIRNVCNEPGSEIKLSAEKQNEVNI